MRRERKVTALATTKIWPVRDNLARVVEYAENHLKTANPSAYTAQELADLRGVLDYAANGEKTAQRFYVSGVNCIAETAYAQMTATKQRFGKTGGNLAYHAYQSFAPGEVSPEDCHRLGILLAKRLWGDKYEVLVSTHLNTHCVHNHFVINSVSFMDGKKLNNNYAMYFDVLRKGSDELCAEMGLSVIENPGRSSGSRYLREAEKRGEPTMHNVIRADIDEAIRRTMTDSQFYGLMKSWGYSFHFSANRKYPTLRPPGAAQATRFKTLGDDYTPERITRRILEHGRPLIVPAVKPKTRHYRLRGSFRDIRRMDGLSALFLVFTLILLKIINRNRYPDRPQAIRYTPELRASIRLMERYSKETRLLCRNKIHTPEQLAAFAASRRQQRKELEQERVRVYGKMKSAKTPEQKATLVEQRDRLSADIKVLRHELFLVGDIEKRTAEIRQKLKAQQEYERQQRGQGKPQQQKSRGVREYGTR